MKARRVTQWKFHKISIAAMVCSFFLPSDGWAQDEDAPLPVAEYPSANPDASAPGSAFSFGGFDTISAGPALTGTSQLRSPSAAGDPLAVRSLAKWGPVSLHPSITYRFTYGDGLQSQPGQETKTEIHEVIPVFRFQIGDKWGLTYTPSFRFYSETNFDDSIDHSLSLSGATQYENWSFGFSQGYSVSSSPLVETAAQTDQEAFTTSFSAGVQLNSKASLDFGFLQSLRFVGDSQTNTLAGQNLGDSREWSTTDWFNYQFRPDFTAGIGIGLGYAEVETDMVYEQILGRISWKPANKLRLNLSGGYEARQFLDSDQDDLLNPLFSIALHYQLFEYTSLSVTGSRTVNTSYYDNQVTESTSINFGVSQRLLGKLMLSAGAGFSTSTYQGTTTGVNPNRDDDSTHYNVSLGMPVLKRGNASVFYSYSENATGQAAFDYSSTQVGAQFTYAF